MSVESFTCIGLDHHQAPIELRERMSIGGAELEEAMLFLLDEAAIDGIVILSTCNRTEVYYTGSELPAHAMERIAARQGVQADDLKERAYAHNGTDAIQHLFRVVSSLESMVVGEYQIMHQVKYAYEQARLHRATNGMLNRLFQRALAVGKEVRNSTGIGRHKLSTASIAVDLARQIHGKLDGSKVLLVGAGDMAELSLQHFMQNGVRHVTIINRNKERAENLAATILHHEDMSVRIRHWSELTASLQDHDVILASTSAPMPIIHKEDVKEAMTNKRGPLMLIDLAVPRDVDPAVDEVDDAYLYNIDHLESVVARNRQLRSEEVDDAAQLVCTRVAEASSEVSDDIGTLRGQIARHFNDLVEQEMQRLEKKVGDLDTYTADIRYALERLAKKCQHPYMSYLRDHSHDSQATRTVRDLLDLDG